METKNTIYELRSKQGLSQGELAEKHEGATSANADAVPSCAAVPKRCVVPLRSPEQRSTSQTALNHTDNGSCLICDANLDFPSNNLYS